MLTQLLKDFNSLANPKKAKNLARFFKTEKGEYGEGDVFLGITVPQQRILAKKYRDLPPINIKKILTSKIHEHRLTALLIMIEQFKKASEERRKILVDVYLRHTGWVNNWDLVDLSADKLLGAYLWDKDRSLLYNLAKSHSLWERRIAMISTYHFIKNNQYADTLALAKILLTDTHDLIHKAVGWMLREVGKRDQKMEIDFLNKHYHRMPRTMLRYAIERFKPEIRRHYVKVM